MSLTRHDFKLLHRPSHGARFPQNFTLKMNKLIAAPLLLIFGEGKSKLPGGAAPPPAAEIAPAAMAT